MHAVPPRAIATYYQTLKTYGQYGATNEGAIRTAFQTLLADTGKAWGLVVLGEQTLKLPNKKQLRLDGEVKDQFNIRRGIWEAKDTKDDLEVEISRKIAAGYPTTNIIFENSQRAVLFQH